MCWGIIGCGNVTEIKSGPALQQADGSCLVAVMRRNAAKAEDYAQRHGVQKWYDNAGALISDPDVNAVYIATPPSSHRAYVLQVAAAGKAVYVEKPMALNYTECKDMIAASENAGVPLFVAYYRRALRRFLQVKTWLDAGAIGKPGMVNVKLYRPPYERDLKGEKHWRIDPAVAGCGYFCDLASHTIDLLQYQLGDIVKAAGFTANQKNLYAAEDAVSAAWQFESGVTGAGIWNFAAGSHEDKVEIVGEKGIITFSTFENEPVRLESDTDTISLEIAHPDHIQQPLVQTIVDQLRGKGACPSTGKTGAKTNRVMDWVLGK